MMDMRELANECKAKQEEEEELARKSRQAVLSGGQPLETMKGEVEEKSKKNSRSGPDSSSEEDEDKEEEGSPPELALGWKDKVEYEENDALDEAGQEEVQWRYPLWRYPRSREKFVEELRSSLMTIDDAFASSEGASIVEATQPFLHPPT